MKNYLLDCSAWYTKTVSPYLLAINSRRLLQQLSCWQKFYCNWFDYWPRGTIYSLVTRVTAMLWLLCVTGRGSVEVKLFACWDITPVESQPFFFPLLIGLVSNGTPNKSTISTIWWSFVNLFPLHQGFNIYVMKTQWKKEVT